MFAEACPGYTPPSSRKIGTTLLEKTIKKLDDEMNTLIQNAQIVSIVSDGWSNLRNDHLVNFIVVVPLKKPILYKVIRDAKN